MNSWFLEILLSLYLISYLYYFIEYQYKDKQVFIGNSSKEYYCMKFYQSQSKLNFKNSLILKSGVIFFFKENACIYNINEF